MIIDEKMTDYLICGDHFSMHIVLPVVDTEYFKSIIIAVFHFTCI